jgi:hypothetical protein
MHLKKGYWTVTLDSLSPLIDARLNQGEPLAAGIDLLPPLLTRIPILYEKCRRVQP